MFAQWIRALPLVLLAGAIPPAGAEGGRAAVTVVHAGRLFTGSELLDEMTVVIEGRRF